MDPLTRRVFLKSMAAAAATAPVFAESDKKDGDTAGASGKDEPRWLRGNMHTHTYWSDGNDFPEMVASWYKDHGYDFLVHTDHNILLEGEKWKTLAADDASITKCQARFGKSWLEIKPDTDGKVQVRLKTLQEYRSKLEEPGKFLLMMGEEVTSPHAVHFNAYNVDRVIEQATEYGPEQRVALMRENMRRINEYQKQSGTNTFPVLNHPNWKSVLTAEMIAKLDELQFFEVYNGIKDSYACGPAPRMSTDKIWDIALSLRLSRGCKTPLYGLATDDAHHYHGKGHAMPGFGWVMVRSSLGTEAILKSMLKGDFYSSTGVILKDIRSDGQGISVEVDPAEGVKYTTEYIGTRRGFDPASKPTLDKDGNAIPDTTQTYSEQVGEVLYSTDKPSSEYKFRGDELYVRARIISDAPHTSPVNGKRMEPYNYDTQRAWCQPVVLI